MKYSIAVLAMAMICSVSFAQTDTTRSGNPVNNSGIQGSQSDDEEEVDGEDVDDETKKLLSALTGFNFTGSEKAFSTLTPVVDFGWSESIMKKKKFLWSMSVNPYTAGQVTISDSSMFLPALMLPGVGGIRINSLLRFQVSGDKEIVLGMPCMGIKFHSNFGDSVSTLIQHNFRTALGFRFKDLFIVGMQYTWGWHHSTSNSESSFEKIFNKKATDFDYVTVTLQTKLSSAEAKNPAYIIIEWRSVMNKDRYEDLPNAKILTLGLRVDFSLDRIAPGASKDEPSKKNPKKLRPMRWL